MMSKCILIFSNYKDITNDFRKFENTDKHKKKRIAFNPTTQIQYQVICDICEILTPYIPRAAFDT